MSAPCTMHGRRRTNCSIEAFRRNLRCIFSECEGDSSRRIRLAPASSPQMDDAHVLQRARRDLPSLHGRSGASARGVSRTRALHRTALSSPRWNFYAHLHGGFPLLRCKSLDSLSPTSNEGSELGEQSRDAAISGILWLHDCCQGVWSVLLVQRHHVFRTVRTGMVLICSPYTFLIHSWLDGFLRYFSAQCLCFLMFRFAGRNYGNGCWQAGAWPGFFFIVGGLIEKAGLVSILTLGVGLLKNLSRHTWPAAISGAIAAADIFTRLAMRWAKPVAAPKSLMTRRGSLIYYLTAWICGCFFMSLAIWTEGFVGRDGHLLRDRRSVWHLFFYFYGLVFGALAVLIGAFCCVES